MTHARKRSLALYVSGASALALACASPALAQTAATDASSTDAAASDGDAIVVTGIRASLESALKIKRDAQGVVDAISAEDIGKFPDTNLAESLQRITGVSIDRSNGEGSKVTVRGFGPDFNLVLLDGRQMPASSLGDCCSAPASRSFDFANLASEGIAAVEVYKSGRASLPTGGIGSVINIVTPRPLSRPGFQGSISAKGVYDHTFEGTKITPEVSGIVSQTFADDKIGILVSGSYQRRKASLAQFNAGWREGYLGSENNWGSLAMPGDPRYAQITNRPDATDVYQVTQNAGYDFTDIDRERINGQVVLQVKPFDSLTATVDYVFSQNTIDARTNSIGVWFNHNNTTSSWTDGPAAGPNFYSEAFAQAEGKDLAITGALAKNRSVNHSIGGNLKWDGPGGLRLEADAHHSTATSKPTSPYGSNIAVGSAIYGVKNQAIDFTKDMPVISVSMYPGSEITAANIRPAGNAFRNAYMRDEINEVALKGGYDFDSSFIESLDFGVTHTDNKVRSAYGFIQNDTWGGTLSAAQTPDGLFAATPLPPALSGMNGSNDPALIPTYFKVDSVGLINLLNTNLGICSATTGGAGTCLASYSVDRRIGEKTWAPYGQANFKFDLLGNPAHFRAGVRYEKTNITSTALTGIPGGTRFTGGNEIGILPSTSSQFLTFTGKYDHWLPAFDLDIAPMSNVKLRAAYSHTITRPDYASLAGGLTVNSPARPDGGGTGGSGNPGLLPYLSKNIDLSAEWYYAPQSYISVGYFHKTVSNFIANTTTQGPAFNLTNPAKGAAYNAAVAALGANAPFANILNYIKTNFPAAYSAPINGDSGGILGVSGDPALNFTFTTPGNSDQVAHLHGWEFALQHNFWDTGFGAILNYTIVKSDTPYNNALRYTVSQFAVTGVSDSANAVLFYDKAGLQARVAYNWRDGFLSGYGFDPYYVEPYGQVDASASYEFGNGFTVFAEGINLTKADRRGHMRNEQTVFFAAPGYARYSAGVRLKF
ncbi:TonB-dependent receptor [Parablastomonas sp. CN1-191]|uniref:TonB-dependent receptor n=1 Tax=Parablastomonas sp. CN1-191 TaxID=3400908 RepID=UPI003BF82987